MRHADSLGAGRTLKAALAFVALLLMLAQGAWGHASLVATSPPAGAVLEHAPKHVTLTFSEPVEVTVLHLLDPGGEALALGAVEAHGSDISVALPPSHPSGTYLLSWRAASADGHPIGGTLAYAVGAANPAAATTTATNHGRNAAIWLTRWLTYLCLFGAIGAAFFRALNPPASGRWARPLIVIGWALLLIDLGLQGLDLADAGAPALLHATLWTLALASPYAATVGLMALALLAAAITLRANGRRTTRVAAAAALALSGVAFAASGHAATAPPEWLARPFVAAHTMLAVAWIGALLPLMLLLRSRREGECVPAGLARFSGWIVPVVMMLVATGFGLAFLQLDQPSDLWRTRYGQVLGAKLILVALLLALAALNRWRHTQPALAGDRAARQRLARTAGAEALVALLILGVVALWRLTPPPRSLHSEPPTPALAFALENPRVHASIARLPDSGRWEITLAQPDGAPFAAQGMTLMLANPEAGIEALRAAAQQQSAGRWSAALPPLPAVGKWQARLEIVVDDFEQITLADTPVPPAADAHAHAAGSAPLASQAGHAHASHPAHAAPAPDAVASAPHSSRLSIADCWVRLLPAPAPSAAYFILHNSSDEAVIVKAAASPAFGSVMLHQTTEENGMSRMSMSGDLAVPAHGSLEFRPGGLHAMLEQPTGHLEVGGRMALHVLSAAGERASTECAVEPPAGRRN